MQRNLSTLQRFREEVVVAMLRVSRLLAMNAEDPRYHALLTGIKAVHLREGSSVTTACRISTGSTPADVTPHFSHLSNERGYFPTATVHGLSTIS